MGTGSRAGGVCALPAGCPPMVDSLVPGKSGYGRGLGGGGDTFICISVVVKQMGQIVYTLCAKKIIGYVYRQPKGMILVI